MKSSEKDVGFLGKETRFEGNLRLDGPFGIDGYIKGKIEGKGNLTIGGEAVIEADIHVSSAFIRGEVHGNIAADQRVELQAPAKVFGNIQAPAVVIGEGVIFEGHTKMYHALERATGLAGAGEYQDGPAPNLTAIYGIVKERETGKPIKNGETLTLDAPPVFEKQEGESLLGDVGDADFESTFDDEAVTKRDQNGSADWFSDQEDLEEGLRLEMDYQEEEELELEPERVKPAAEKPRNLEPKPKPGLPRKAPEDISRKAKRGGRSKVPLLIVIILLFLGGGAGAIVYFAPELVPEKLAFPGVTPKREPEDPGVVRLRFTSVSGSFVQNTEAGQLFVVRGAISNNYAMPRSYVLLKGSILDDKGEVVKAKVAYAGNVFTENELQNLTMEQIDQGLRDRAGKGNVNVNIQPQSSVPFMIVFEELPDNLSEFTMKPLSSSPGQ